MKISLHLLVFTCILGISCNKSIKKDYVKELKVIPSSYENGAQGCRDQLNYIPDLEHLDHTTMKYVRVNFHVMCDDEGNGNFDRKNGRVFIHQVLNAANDKLSRNKKMNLPPGNDTPVVPMRYRFKLTGQPNDPSDDGIYFHYDDELYAMIGTGKHKNNYDREVYEKYGIQKDTVLNIFVMTHHIDSLQSSTYKADSKGIGFSNFVKVTHWYQGTRDTTWNNGKPKTKFTKWNAIKLLNHEIGHTLGLRHTWRGNDGCADTPTHTNCWNKTKGKKPCDEYWSNNFMDYNAHSSAWSPCQIGTIHRNLADKRKKTRRLLVPNWCTLDESKTISIKDTVEWNGAKDLEGHLVIEDGGMLTVRCRLSMPKDAKIIVHPKGQLILENATLENDCGDTWKGIEAWSEKDAKGIVDYRAGSKILNIENEISILED